MPSTNIATIDPQQIFIQLGTKRITGFASGQYFSAVKRNDDSVYEEGSDGEGLRVRIPSNAWDLTITLMQSSRSNDMLWERYLLDLNAPGGLVLPFKVTHQGTQLVSAKTWITKPTDFTLSNGVETRVWPLLATFLVGTVQGISS
ncbi:MAG: hypothetical protein GY926_19670 [bacterium]|nr:hypothetical protein [bacterium]